MTTVERKRFVPLLKPWLFVALTALSAVALVELFSLTLIRLRLGRLESPETFFHSYLATPAHHHAEHCRRPNINAFGLAGPELPLRKNPAAYVVLVVGGSVAEQFMESRPGHPPALETLLNASYRSPTGKPFEVINGAIAAGAQPMQAISFLLLHDLADAVIGLEGYNELGNYGSDNRIEAPARIWDELQAAGYGDYRQMLAQKASHEFYAFARDHFPMSRSYTGFALAYGLVALVDEAARHGQEIVASAIPGLPPELGAEERKSFFREQYAKYLGAIDAIAKHRQMKAAFFFQPVPAFDKQLTPAERAVVGDLAYGPLYREMVTGMLVFRRSGLPVFPLLDAFKSYRGALYVDPIHVRTNPGNELLAGAMVRRLVSAWGLKKLSESGSR
ncbi:MAG: hypothetical protein HY074_05095 [Deltaproteobacteria bacterium]|nr:hypothetical protein [Deltaproteobacteria bacterium]